MIEINLVPANLRKKQLGGMGILDSIGLPKEVLLGTSGIFIAVLILIHGLLLSMWIAKFVRYGVYKVAWTRMLPDKNHIDALNQQMQDLKSRASTINNLTSQQNMLWSQKLNILSDALPKEVWLKQIGWNNEILTITGCAVSRFHDEISVVGNFVSNLHRTQDFMKNFLSLELNSVNRTKKGGTEVADFIITAKAK